MHDTLNDEETKNKVKEDINEYFDLSALDLEDLDTFLKESRSERKKEENEKK